MAENVPAEVIKNARKGNVRLLKAGYLAEAAYTPNAPAARPAAPPPNPPFNVALESMLASSLAAGRVSFVLTCSAQLLPPWL